MNAYNPNFLAERILYRDGLILVIDKPAGLVVHARPGANSTRDQDTDNLEHYFNALRFGLPRDPVLAHRLDRDTSGCLILARHPKAARKMGKLFQEGSIRKTYLAVCEGIPDKLSGTIDMPLRKLNTKSGWNIVAQDHEEAKPATTVYRVLKSWDGLSLIECRPKTGRTHQIRVHLSLIGAPILGDTKYGSKGAKQNQHSMMLHASALSIPISKNKPSIQVSAQPPTAMLTIIEALGYTQIN